MPLTYAIGDIHGSLDKLERLMLRCEQDAAGQPATFVFLGDYIDRGPNSSGVIAYLLEMQSRFGERVIALKGNHEAMALSAVDGEVPLRMWFAQGGGEARWRAMAGVPSRRIAAGSISNGCIRLRLSHDDGRRFFVHAGVDPKKPLDDQAEGCLALDPGAISVPHRRLWPAGRAWPHPATDRCS